MKEFFRLIEITFLYIKSKWPARKDKALDVYFRRDLAELERVKKELSRSDGFIILKGNNP